MSCDECRDLSTHAFRNADDLIHALRLAAEEVNRGVLLRVDVEAREPVEEEAMSSVIAAGAGPASLRYRFRCSVCGDTFTLCADTESAAGAWTRD